jgi:rhomboid protease GluP
MYSFRQLAPPTVDFYGPARTVIIFVLGSAAGFLLSSVAGHFLGWMPFRFLRGADLTVGASAGIFALIGALAYYGRRTGSSAVRTFITSNAVIWILWGVLMPGIDNYAHAGGFLGGYAAARIMDPLTRERVDHMIIALGCLVLSAIAVLASFIVGVPTR